MRPVARIAAALLVIAVSVPPAAAESARELMARVERNQSAPAEVAALRMRLIDRAGFERGRTVSEYRARDVKTGMESSLIFFEDPPDILGTGLLSVEREDGRDNQWLYLPAVGKVKRIHDSGRTDYFLGTDMTFEDLSVEDIDQFIYAYEDADSVWLGRAAAVVRASPTDSAAARSGYRFRRLWVDPERSLVVRAEYYGKAGTLVKELDARDIRAHGLYWRAGEISVRNHARDHRTELKMDGRSFPENFPAGFFSARTLARGTKPLVP